MPTNEVKMEILNSASVVEHYETCINMLSNVKVFIARYFLFPT